MANGITRVSSRGERDEGEEDPVPSELVNEGNAGPAGPAWLRRDAERDADGDGEESDHGQERLVAPAAEELGPEETQPCPARPALAVARHCCCSACPVGNGDRLSHGRPGHCEVRHRCRIPLR